MCPEAGPKVSAVASESCLHAFTDATVSDGLPLWRCQAGRNIPLSSNPAASFGPKGAFHLTNLENRIATNLRVSLTIFDFQYRV